MTENEDQLSTSEAGALRKLAGDETPPDFLERRIINALKDADLVRSRWTGFRNRLIPIGTGVAAAIILLMMGAAAGAWWRSGSLPHRDEPGFLLMLRSNTTQSPTGSATDELARVREYGDWARTISAEGSLVGGEKLTGEVRLLEMVAGSVAVIDVPPGTDKNSIGGYFLLSARDYNQATDIAKTCPHLKYGGTVEIRQIDQGPGAR